MPFSQLGLSSKDWTLIDLAQNIAKQLGQDPSGIATEDAPQDVLIRFLRRSPNLD